MRLINADEIYKRIAEEEELARQRVIDTPSRLPNGAFNPCATRYATQLDERTRFKFMVADAPTVDAEPIRHGRWILIHEPDESGNALYQCSSCHRGETHTPIVEVPYCWHCGAKMDEVAE